MGGAIWLYLVPMPAGASESRAAGAHARAGERVRLQRKAAARGSFLPYCALEGGRGQGSLGLLHACYMLHASGLACK